ncbi:unnamed protein product, partial [Meganyctiphanes norvegica]
MVKLSIIFDNPSKVFFNGQPITGRVQVVLDDHMSARGIEIEFKGYCKVQWTETETVGEGEDKKTISKKFESYEKYYKQEYLVWGDGSNTHELPPGTHTFNFCYTLPTDIPSSFQAEHGKVQHECEAKIDRPWKTDTKKKVIYSVNSIYDLNLDPKAKHPIEKQDHKTLCCWCCKSGPISIVLRIPRSGYVPGESIVINCECDNKSNRKCHGSKARIYQHVVQKASYKNVVKTKKQTRKVAELERGPIMPGDSDTWSNVEFKVPALPPSHLRHCGNIDVYYKFEFKVDPAKTSYDLEAEADLIIGSIPLQEHFMQFTPGMMQPHGPPPGAPPAGYPGAPPPAGYPGAPPPAGYPGAPPPAGYPGAPPPAGYPGAPPPAGYPGAPPPAGYPGAPPPAGYPGAPPPAGYPGAPPPAGYPGAPPPAGYPGGPVWPGFQTYPNMPPPSYSNDMYGKQKYDSDDSDDGEFVPSYVTYNTSSEKSDSGPGFGTGLMVGAAAAAVGGYAAYKITEGDGDKGSEHGD